MGVHAHLGRGAGACGQHARRVPLPTAGRRRTSRARRVRALDMPSPVVSARPRRRPILPVLAEACRHAIRTRSPARFDWQATGRGGWRWRTRSSDGPACSTAESSPAREVLRPTHQPRGVLRHLGRPVVRADARPLHDCVRSAGALAKSAIAARLRPPCSGQFPTPGHVDQAATTRDGTSWLWICPSRVALAVTHATVTRTAAHA